jgi:hypothetical protein
VTDNSQSKNRDLAVWTSRMFWHVSHKLVVIADARKKVLGPSR